MFHKKFLLKTQHESPSNGTWNFSVTTLFACKKKRSSQNSIGRRFVLHFQKTNFYVSIFQIKLSMHDYSRRHIYFSNNIIFSIKFHAIWVDINCRWQSKHRAAIQVLIEWLVYARLLHKVDLTLTSVPHYLHKQSLRCVCIVLCKSPFEYNCMVKKMPSYDRRSIIKPCVMRIGRLMWLKCNIKKVGEKEKVPGGIEWHEDECNIVPHQKILKIMFLIRLQQQQQRKKTQTRTCMCKV